MKVRQKVDQNDGPTERIQKNTNTKAKSQHTVGKSTDLKESLFDICVSNLNTCRDFY